MPWDDTKIFYVLLQSNGWGMLEAQVESMPGENEKG